MGIIVGLAQELGMPLPTGKAVKQLCDLASKKGMAESDITALYLLLEEEKTR